MGGKRLNDFSRKNVHKGSLILACNDIWLLGQTTRYINQCIKAEIQHTPVNMTFRAKKWMKSARARRLRKQLQKSRNKAKKKRKKIKQIPNTLLDMNTRINEIGRGVEETLRVFLGESEFSRDINQIAFEINSDRKETSDVRGSTLVWRAFDPSEGNLLTCEAIGGNNATVFAIGAVRIPGCNDTIETV